MNYTKYILIAMVTSILLLLIGFSIGRYTGQKPDVTTHTTDNLQDTKDTHTTTKTVTVKEPTGKVETTTTTDTTTTDKKVDNVVTNTQVLSPKPQINISAMVGADLRSLSSGVIYGVEVSKQFIGLNVGLFGLTNGTVGVTAGISF